MKLAAPPDTGRIYLENLRWSTYLALTRDLEDRRGRLAYDGGRLEIVTLSPEHESLKKIIGRLVEAFTEELGIRMASSASTTLNRKDLDKGVEADESYYIANEAAFRGKKRIDLPKDPPPDLVIEVAVTRRVLDRLPLYEAMAVPEVWCHDGKKLAVLVLEGGKYVERRKSKVLPMLPMAELARFIDQRGKLDETALLRSFRAWVRGRSW
jgi:Uma2 family endonuclease